MPRKWTTRNATSASIDPMKSAPDDFEKAAGERQTSLAREIVALLRHNKKWWLVPIIVALLAVGVLIALAVLNPAAASLLYPLF